MEMSSELKIKYYLNGTVASNYRAIRISPVSNMFPPLILKQNLTAQYQTVSQSPHETSSRPMLNVEHDIAKRYRPLLRIQTFGKTATASFKFHYFNSTATLQVGEP
jgi:hypothetical protein